MCVTLVLAACGGGSGGGGGSGSTPPPNTPPPPGPSAADLSNAQNAKLHMTQQPNWLTITWHDSFNNERGYRVERRVGTDPWVAFGTLPASDGGSVSWERFQTPTDSGTYRVVALLDGYSVPLQAAPDESEMTIDMTAPPQIQIEPAGLNDVPVQVSVTNATPALSVTYRLNDVQIANVTSGDTFAHTVPTQRLADGNTLKWSAEIQKSAGLTVVTSRNIVVYNSLPAVLLQVAPARSIGDSLVLTATASSGSGIVSVQFFANDNPLHLVREPDRRNRWTHTVDMRTLPRGLNRFRAVATDAIGATVSMEAEYTLDSLPSLSVEGPFEGMIATNGRLDVRGTFGGNVDGALLSVTLHDAASAMMDRTRTILRTRTSPFHLDYPIEGQSGERILTVRVETPDGRVNSRSYSVILPSTQRGYELIATDVARLLAADQGTLLYQKNSGEVVLRNAAGVESQLQVPPGLTFTQWWLSAGHVLAQERMTQHVHVFNGPGTTIDVSALAGDLYPDSLSRVVRGPWISWWRHSILHIFNLDTGVLTNVTLPGATFVHTLHDLDTTPGSERVLVAATINGMPGIYSYQLATSTIELLLQGSYRELRTDGTRLAWRDDSDIMTGAVLSTALLTDLTAATVLASDYRGSLFVEDGLVGWGGANTTGLAVYDGSTTTTLDEIGGGFERDAYADGQLIFVDPNELHGWNPTSGEYLLLDAMKPALHTQGVAYLLTGDTGTMYRTTLP